MKTRILYRLTPGPWLSYGLFPAATAGRVAANLQAEGVLKGNTIETHLQPQGEQAKPQQPKDTAQTFYAGTLF